MFCVVGECRVDVLFCEVIVDHVRHVRDGVVPVDDERDDVMDPDPRSLDPGLAAEVSWVLTMVLTTPLLTSYQLKSIRFRAGSFTAHRTA